jgi:DNA-directed RNA polymerase specialized sigma24 family protein
MQRPALYCGSARHGDLYTSTPLEGNNFRAFVFSQIYSSAYCMSEPARERRFPTTHWSLVVRLRSHDPKESENALHEVFTTYRYPLYGFLRAGGMRHEDAEDILQGFFEKMLRNDGLTQADSERGKLRTFLLTALSRFRINWHRGEQRRHKRVQPGGDLWDEEEALYRLESQVLDETSEHSFDRRWALQIIARVRATLCADYDRRGRRELHDALAPHLTRPAPETESFADVAARLGVSENALRISLSRMRGDFRECLIQEVKLTLDEGQDVKEELRYLLGLFES